MKKQKLFQYAIILHNEEGKSRVIKDHSTVLANDQHSASMMAVLEIPSDYRDQIDNIEMAIRPF